MRLAGQLLRVGKTWRSWPLLLACRRTSSVLAVAQLLKQPHANFLKHAQRVQDSGGNPFAFKDQRPQQMLGANSIGQVLTKE